jgi:hypothetical protein
MRGLLRNWTTQDLLRHSTVNNGEITGSSRSIRSNR